MADQPTGTAGVSDDLDSVLALLKEASEGNVPDSIADMDKGEEAAKGPASHAFGEKNKQLKTALSVIERQRSRIKELEKVDEPPARPVGTGDPASQDTIIYQNLRMQALRNLGITDEKQAPNSFGMEMNRLWATQATQVEQRRSAVGRASTFIDSILGTIPQLSEQDRVAVKADVQKMDVLQQVSEDVVRSVAATYLGQKLLRGEDVSASAGTENGQGNSGEGSDGGDTSARVSGLKNQGRPGMVRPPDTGKPSNRPQPPSAEEAKEMKSLGFRDVIAYRKAKERKDSYKGR